MAEGQSPREVESHIKLADAVQQVFERRAAAGKRKLILETYQQKFNQLLLTLPGEKRDTIAVEIQRLFVTIGGAFSEYGSRFIDFVRNVFVFPMIVATEDFPKDKYYQMNLAGAKAWGEFALNTTKTATAERMSYRDNFLGSVLTGIPTGGLMGAVAMGTLEGTKIGTLAGGLGGAALGAVGGAAGGALLGGATSLFLRAKDAIIGPPVLYYSIFSLNGPTFQLNVTEQTVPIPHPPFT